MLHYISNQFVLCSTVALVEMLLCSEQSPVPLLVRPPPADDVSYDAVAVQLDESVEQQSVSGHTATTSRLVIVLFTASVAALS